MPATSVAWWPTEDEPVKDTMSISLRPTRTSPISDELPVTMLITPDGSPASCITFASMRRHIGSSLAGFMTTEFPAAIAGAIFEVPMYRG